jgi:hypothetical protein
MYGRKKGHYTIFILYQLPFFFACLGATFSHTTALTASTKKKKQHSPTFFRPAKNEQQEGHRRDEGQSTGGK